MPADRGLTIALAGGSGAGKSTIARELAKRLDAAVASFGDFVRHLAAEAGESSERQNLQRLGQQHVDADPVAFVHAFLEWSSPQFGRPLIIDGVRHVVVDRALRAWAEAAAADYALVFVDTATAERARRRQGGDEDVIRRLDAHPVERENAHGLPEIADIVVDGGGSLESIIARIAASTPAVGRRLT